LHLEVSARELEAFFRTRDAGDMTERTEARGTGNTAVMPFFERAFRPA
jgi:hypothetical protein